MNVTRYSPASRKNVETSTDPYLSRRAAPSIVECPECGAVSRNRRWITDERTRRELLASGAPVARHACPACRKISDGYPSGIVTLSGAYLAFHGDEIRNLIRNEEARAAGANPLERIMEMKEEGGRLVLTTTDEKLAQKIGRELHKAFHGKLTCRWAEDTGFVRVNWVREN